MSDFQNRKVPVCKELIIVFRVIISWPKNHPSAAWRSHCGLKKKENIRKCKFKQVQIVKEIININISIYIIKIYCDSLESGYSLFIRPSPVVRCSSPDREFTI